MDSKDNVKDKITLESINKKLISVEESLNKRFNTIEEEIEKIPGKKENFGYFNVNLLFSLAFVLLAVSLPIVIQLQNMSKETLALIVISYIIFVFIFIFIAGKILKRIVEK